MSVTPCHERSSISMGHIQARMLEIKEDARLGPPKNEIDSAFDLGALSELERLLAYLEMEKS